MTRPGRANGKPLLPVRPDKDCGKAWDRIMAIARDHALVVNAAGGVAILAMPDEQRKAGLRGTVLRAHCMKGV